MFLSSEWVVHYLSYHEDCRDYCDDNYGAWNCFVLVPMVHSTGMFLYGRLLYGGYLVHRCISVGGQEKLYLAVSQGCCTFAVLNYDDSWQGPI